MENMLGELNGLVSLRLPSKYLKEIFILKVDYDDYFITEIPYKFEAINNIENDVLKLQALVELDVESQELLINYELEYKKFLFGFAFGDTANELSPGSFSHVYEFFFKYEEMYRHIPDQIVIAIKKLRARIEINDKYKVNKSRVKSTGEILPLDINEEFSKLFVNKSIEAKFIDLLIDTEYLTDDEKWQGVSNRPGELREAYKVLKELKLLTPGECHLSSLRIFYKRFGLQPEEVGVQNHYISTKSLSSNLETKDCKIFKDILTPLTKLLL